MAFNFTPANFVPAPAKHADDWIMHARISSPYIYDLPWEEAINNLNSPVSRLKGDIGKANTSL